MPVLHRDSRSRYPARQAPARADRTRSYAVRVRRLPHGRGEADFRYLLPRILDVSINSPTQANDPEIVLGKLALAKWRSWSEAEQRAVEEFIDAWFEWALARDLGWDDGWVGWEAESVLCGAARAGLPLEPWLVRLNDPAAAPVLADLKQRFPSQLSGFWKDAPAGFRELSTILAQGEA
jgi:hypothetical protein